jgi:hypothetical protein
MSYDCYTDLLITHLLPEQKQKILDCFFQADAESEWESKFFETFCPDSEYESSSEIYEVQISNPSQEGQFSCSFYAEGEPPLEALNKTAQKIPNALIETRYYDAGMDFCGIALFKGTKALEYSFQLSDAKEMWLKEYHPDLYLHLQAQDTKLDAELEDQLEEICGEIEFDIVNWILDPIAECLHKVLSSPNQYGASVDLNVRSCLITIPLGE